MNMIPQAVDAIRDFSESAAGCHQNRSGLHRVHGNTSSPQGAEGGLGFRQRGGGDGKIIFTGRLPVTRLLEQIQGTGFGREPGNHGGSISFYRRRGSI